MRKKFTVLKVIILIIIAAGTLLFTFVANTPAIQLLISSVGFSERTLNNPGYLAYNIDLMEMFQSYMNADLEFSGKAYLKKSDSFRYSTTGKIAGVRSFTQRKLSLTTDMSVLWANLGGIDLYAQDETLYLVVPMLNNAAYAFDTDMDLFKKGPSFTSDISREWFRDNYTNFIDFFNSIKIEKTGKTFTDENNNVSYEYKMTIPKGEGKFIFDLLGIDMPDHNIVCSMYLDRFYQTKRIEFDLSETSQEGSNLVVFGDSMGVCILTIMLPDSESCIMTITRNSEITYTNSFDCNIVYNTAKGDVITIDDTYTFDKQENGIYQKITDATVKKNGQVVAEGYCEGSIIKRNRIDEDVFKDAIVDFDSIEVISWKVLRDDTEQFVNDMIAEAKTIMF